MVDKLQDSFVDTYLAALRLKGVIENEKSTSEGGRPETAAVSSVSRSNSIAVKLILVIPLKLKANTSVDREDGKGATIGGGGEAKTTS